MSDMEIACVCLGEKRPLTVQRRMLTESFAGFLVKVDDLVAKRVFVVEVGDFCTAFRPEII